MNNRILGNTDRSISPVGLGCMGLSHAFGTPLEKAEAAKKIQAAYDMGYTFSTPPNAIPAPIRTVAPLIMRKPWEWASNLFGIKLCWPQSAV